MSNIQLPLIVLTCHTPQGYDDIEDIEDSMLKTKRNVLFNIASLENTILSHHQ